MKKNFFVSLILILCLMFGTLTACGPSVENSSSSSESSANGNVTKTVSSIAVKDMPSKTEYSVGDTATSEGGTITVNYSDNTSETISMTDPDVTVVFPNMGAAGNNKNVVVRYGGKQTTFKINITVEQLELTLEPNYEGGSAVKQNIGKGEVLKVAPAVPATFVNDSYTFDGWYTDATTTMEYDYSNTRLFINENLTLYAKWIGSDYKTVTYDFNYDGLAEKIVELNWTVGTPINKYAVDPVRNDYRFDGWYTTQECTGSAYNFETNLTDNLTLYAKWIKTKTGVSTYVFEAENTDLHGKSYHGLSGTSNAYGLVMNKTGFGASGDAYVGYMNDKDAGITFEIVSDSTVSDVTLVFRLSMEARNYTFTPENLTISLNGRKLSFNNIVFEGVPGWSADGATPVPFADFTIGTNLSLDAGTNTISITVNNSDAIAGTTITAAGPLIDCVKLTTSAVCIWDGRKGLPMHSWDY